MGLDFIQNDFVNDYGASVVWMTLYCSELKIAKLTFAVKL